MKSIEQKAGSAAAPVALRLPRVQLDALLRSAIGQLQVDRLLVLAHSALVLQDGPDGLQALAGPLSTQPLRPLPPRRLHEPAEAGTHGLVLVAVAPPGAEPPMGDEACERWLQQHAAGFRMATAAVDPAIVLLWLRLDGQGKLLFRHGAPLVGVGPGSVMPRWVPIQELLLPGGGMHRVAFGGLAISPATTTTPDESAKDGAVDAESRDSRQAAAFGVARLHQLQRSQIVLVGAGRVGSVFAHGLVRLGVRRLTVIEPDHMEPHNEDGDVAPLHEGRPKVEALRRFLRGLQRPGCVLDLRQSPVSSPEAGALVAQADAVVVCVDNDAARLWANAWALVHNRCLLAVATNVTDSGAESDLRLLPAGSGCLACVGGYVQRSELLQQLEDEGPVATPSDFRQQRRGSLRSWSALSAHMGQRMLEQHLLRPGGGALFRQLSETPQGGLQVRDWRPEDDGVTLRGCPFCSQLQGAGHLAVICQRLKVLVGEWVGAGA